MCSYRSAHSGWKTKPNKPGSVIYKKYISDKGQASYSGQYQSPTVTHFQIFLIIFKCLWTEANYLQGTLQCLRSHHFTDEMKISHIPLTLCFNSNSTYKNTFLLMKHFCVILWGHGGHCKHGQTLTQILRHRQGAEGTGWSWEDDCVLRPRWDYFLWDPFARQNSTALRAALFLFSHLHQLWLFVCESCVLEGVCEWERWCERL